MTKTEIKEFKRLLKDVLVKQYNMTEIEAHRAVRDSYLSEALERDNDYVEHDTIEEWAEFVYNEVSNTELMMM